MKDFTQLASEESLATTQNALEENGFKVLIAENKEEAKKLTLNLIPHGAKVMENTSKTLETIGVKDEIDNSGNYISVHKQVLTMDREKEAAQIKRLRSVVEYAIGSVHAVTEDGHLMMASGSGSQIPGYAYGADHVILVAGTHKIVKDIPEGLKRIYEHSLPLENERMRQLYGEPSSPRRILIINSERAPRTTVILVKEVLGF